MHLTARLGDPTIPGLREPAERGTTPSASMPGAPAPGNFPPLSRAAWRVFGLLALLFVLAVALDLNGSSSAIYRNVRWNDLRSADSASGLLWSTPKAMRSDEWQVWTPAILSQARQSPVTFPTENPALGPGKVPLLMGLPARYYTTALRPPLWGYFFLPIDYAFAWNWQWKAFGLFAGLFLLCWTLTNGRLGPALFGAAMVEFSPFVQWWFSSPSMLPEMLASWSVALVAAISLLGPQRPVGRLVSLSALILAGLNFVLCCYVGFEMPLLYLGVFLLAGYAWQKRLHPWPGVLWIAAATGVIVAALVPWFLACLPDFRIVAHTVYPGQRVCTGGHLPFLWYVSAFYDFALTETTCPKALGNVCEAANFYPLWVLPVSLGLWSLGRRLLHRPTTAVAWLSTHGIAVSAGAYLGLMTLFCFVPFPRWFCDATLLTHGQEARCTVGIGLAGTLILVLSLVRQPRGWKFPRASIVVGPAWAVAVLAILLLYRAQLGSLQTPPRLLATWAIAGGLGAGYLFAPAAWFQLGAVSVFAVTMASVNPLCRGLPELTSSATLARVRQSVAMDPQAQWVTFDSLFGTEMLKAAGANTITGVHPVPDFAILRALDPTGRDDAAYNRYAHLIFFPENKESAPVVELYNMVYCKVRITPAQMVARFPAARFVAAPHPMPELAALGFRLVGAVPIDRLWLYHKDRAPAPDSTAAP